MLAKEKTWKHIFNTNGKLSEKQIMPSKTTINWLFHDIWCYLFIACFDWKVCVFQQTLARVYYILKCHKKSGPQPLPRRYFFGIKHRKGEGVWWSDWVPIFLRVKIIFDIQYTYCTCFVSVGDYNVISHLNSSSVFCSLSERFEYLGNIIICSFYKRYGAS